MAASETIKSDGFLNVEPHRAERWLAAEKIAAELADGKSKSQLAREIGKSNHHVLYMERSWEMALKCQVRPHFNEVYNSPEVRAPNKLKSGSEGSRRSA